MNLMVKLKNFTKILADDKLLIFCTARQELQPHYKQTKECLVKFQFCPNACTRTISTNCKGAKTDKFNFGQRKAKHDFRAKPLQRTDGAAFDGDTAKPAGDNYFH